jgi:hypothetical protein
MVSPVRGLRPSRAARSETENVPKPTKVTLSPAATASEIRPAPTKPCRLPACCNWPSAWAGSRPTARGASLSRRGFGYIIALTVLVTFTGAAGMYAFENVAPGGMKSYGEALWWTAMVLTTMGSQYWPQTVEGCVLCVFLALYAFTVFGYVTATLATFFIGRDAENDKAELAGAKQLAALREEVIALREEIRRTTAAAAVVVKRDSVEEKHA